MLKKTVDLGIPIHFLFDITSLVHQVGAWDDMVDRKMHQFAYVPVLCALSLTCDSSRRVEPSVVS